jgi:hypothetical protein
MGVTFLSAAIAQIPEPFRKKILVTVDGAGSTHALVDHITALNAENPDMEIRYAVGFDLDARARAVVGRIPEQAWCGAGRRRRAAGRRAGRRAHRRLPHRPGRRPAEDLARGHAGPRPAGAAGGAHPGQDGAQRAPPPPPRPAAAAWSA